VRAFTTDRNRPSVVWCNVEESSLRRFAGERNLHARSNKSVHPNARPFLRWAGSKRRLLKHLIPFIPPSWNKYYEPFLGGGSLFFFLGPAKAEISDASAALIETYRGVRRDPEAVLELLNPLRPDKVTFDLMRSRPARSASEAAAKFIFLNKACWNGLYRVNSKGIFNVPYGWPRSDFLIDEVNFLRCAEQLRKRSISIRHQDFEKIDERVAQGDFVFLDPPYITSHNMNGFADWNESLFSWRDQIRLASMARRMVKRGANVLVTNADHIEIRELYNGFAQTTFERSSTLAGDLKYRKTTSEAIFFDGPAYADMSAQAVCSKRNHHGNTKHRSRGANRPSQAPEE
jgi:DNA adenine methylase